MNEEQIIPDKYQHSKILRNAYYEGYNDALKYALKKIEENTND